MLGMEMLGCRADLDRRQEEGWGCLVTPGCDRGSERSRIWHERGWKGKEMRIAVYRQTSWAKRSVGFTGLLVC